MGWEVRVLSFLNSSSIEIKKKKSFENVKIIHQWSPSSSESLDDGDEDDVDDEKEEHVDPQVLAEAEVQHGEAAREPRDAMKWKLKEIGWTEWQLLPFWQLFVRIRT